MDWMDWEKCIAIFLVVYGHMRSPFMSYIFAFHMPFFFIISGFLQKRRSWKDELTNSIKRLLIPYVLFNIYLLIYSYFTGEYESDYPMSMLLGLQWNLSMACRPLWFLWALFFCRLLYTALPRKTAKLMSLPFILLCYFANGTPFMKPETDYFQLWTAVECYPFFALGAWMKDHWYRVRMENFMPLLRYLILLGFFGLGAWLTTRNGSVNIFRCHPGDNALLFYASATLMSVSLFCLIHHLFNFANASVRTISEGTLLIFAVHQSILWPMHEALSHGLVTFFVAIGLLCVFRAILPVFEQFAPVLIGKWK